MAIALAAVSASAQAGVRPAGPYANWVGLGAGYYNLDQRVTVHAHPSGAPLFWAHQFGFNNENYGGYIGLQMDQTHKWVRCSLWNATAAQGANCQTFGGEGVGWTCVVDPYNWVAGRTYRLRVSQQEADGAQRWWAAWVQDTVTGTDTQIGRIRVPTQNLVHSQVSWTEYYGVDLASCADTFRSKVIWEFPTANNGAFRATSVNNTLGYTDQCPTTARVAHVPSGSMQDTGITPTFDGCSGTPTVRAATPGPNTVSGYRTIEVEGWRTDNGAPVQIWTLNSAPFDGHQKWQAQCQSDGTWRICAV